MHRKHALATVVYETLFPNPGPVDPISFAAHLTKNLVGEVRVETATFYGALDTVEARYPGLNYSYGPHRKRLCRFPHHARLLDAFDRLGLTDSEIHGFCRWEGTLWARERYERDEGVNIEDTTGIYVRPWVDQRNLPSPFVRDSDAPSQELDFRTQSVKTGIVIEAQEVPLQSASPARGRDSVPAPEEDGLIDRYNGEGRRSAAAAVLDCDNDDVTSTECEAC